MSTLQGLRFFHYGQFEGRRARLPVQLGVMPDEPVDDRIAATYRRLLDIIGDDVFHSGEWRAVDIVSAGDDSYDNLAAWRWRLGPELRVVVVNLEATPAQGRLRLNDDLSASLQAAETLVFDDLLNDRSYPWTRGALEASGGLYVRLDRGHSHIFAVRTALEVKS